MPVPKKYLADFEELAYYHVFNRTNNGESLFRTYEHHLVFLNNFERLLSPFATLYCWCLLPNHFHFLVRIHSGSAIRKHLAEMPLETLTEHEKKFLHNTVELGELIEQSFRRFFISYSMSFNRRLSRKGNLFYKPFKRVLIKDEDQLLQTVIYIHFNPVKHELTKNFSDYKWSSWHQFNVIPVEDEYVEEVFSWFNGKPGFLKAHGVDAIS